MFLPRSVNPIASNSARAADLSSSALGGVDSCSDARIAAASSGSSSSLNTLNPEPPCNNPWPCGIGPSDGPAMLVEVADVVLLPSGLVMISSA